eukprot:2988219-Amphidinium_carterae.1
MAGPSSSRSSPQPMTSKRAASDSAQPQQKRVAAEQTKGQNKVKRDGPRYVVPLPEELSATSRGRRCLREARGALSASGLSGTSQPAGPDVACGLIGPADCPACASRVAFTPSQRSALSALACKEPGLMHQELAEIVPLNARATCGRFHK